MLKKMLKKIGIGKDEADIINGVTGSFEKIANKLQNGMDLCEEEIKYNKDIVEKLIKSNERLAIKGQQAEDFQTMLNDMIKRAVKSSIEKKED